MKKFRRFYLPLLIVFFAGCFYSVAYHKNVVKAVIAGDGRIVGPPKKALIRVNGVERPDIKIYEGDERFYIVTESDPAGSVLIVAVPLKDVILTNGGCREILAGFLFLADCAKGKFYGINGVEPIDLQLKISDSEIDFVVPEQKFEILFQR